MFDESQLLEVFPYSVDLNHPKHWTFVHTAIAAIRGTFAKH